MDAEANRRLLLANKRRHETLMRIAALGASEEDMAFLRECLLSTSQTPSSAAPVIVSSPIRRNSLVDHQNLFSSRAAAAATPPQLLDSKEYTDLMSYFQIEYAPNGQAKFSRSSKPAYPVVDGEGMNATKESWMEFDIFDFAVQGQVTMRMGEALLERHGFVREFQIPTNTLRSFLLLLDTTYLPVPYHNSIHGADVAHAMSYFLLHGNLASRGDSLLHFAALIAALGHDVAHPGFNNNFLIHTDDAVAITFNDKSPLENMHASTLFQILHTHDILQSLSKQDKRKFREYTIGMILATDNAVHADVVKRIQCAQPSDVHVFQACLHAADLAGGGKTVALSEQWTSRLLEEFYVQGDLERELELYEVMGVMDRNSKLHRGNFQDYFIQQICIPLYRDLQDFCTLDFAIMLQAFERNAKHWRDQVDKHKQLQQQQQQGEEEVVVASSNKQVEQVVSNLQKLSLPKSVQAASQEINARKKPPTQPPAQRRLSAVVQPGSVASRVAAITSKSAKKDNV